MSAAQKLKFLTTDDIHAIVNNSHVKVGCIHSCTEGMIYPISFTNSANTYELVRSSITDNLYIYIHEFYIDFGNTRRSIELLKFKDNVIVIDIKMYDLVYSEFLAILYCNNREQQFKDETRKKILANLYPDRYLNE